MRTGDKGKMPILYVCLFDKESIYCAAAPGAPPVPEVNEKALETAKIFEKTANGTAAEALKITDRDFGWAAARTPKLGDEVGFSAVANMARRFGITTPINTHPSMVLGSADLVAEARVHRKRMGGGMRQVGVLAAVAA